MAVRVISSTRRTRRPKVRNTRKMTTKPPSNVMMTTRGSHDATTLRGHHRLPCTPGESYHADCLNAGECFVSMVFNGENEVRVASCKCSPEWIGVQCERRYVDFSLDQDSYKASVAVGIIFGFILFFVSVMGGATYCWFRYKRRRADSIKRPSVRSPSVLQPAAAVAADAAEDEADNGSITKIPIPCTPPTPGPVDDNLLTPYNVVQRPHDNATRSLSTLSVKRPRLSAVSRGDSEDSIPDTAAALTADPVTGSAHTPFRKQLLDADDGWTNAFESDER